MGSPTIGVLGENESEKRRVERAWEDRWRSVPGPGGSGQEASGKKRSKAAYQAVESGELSPSIDANGQSRACALPQ